MDPGAYLAFLVPALVVVLSPGPDTTLILRHALTSGARSGLVTMAGINLGLIAHTAATVAGLSLLISSTPGALAAVAVAGAIYLAWLGWQALTAGVAPLGDTGPAGATGSVRAFRAGLLSNLFNPKIILLFVSLMPQFVREDGRPVSLQLAVMGGSIVALSALWQTPLALAADGLRRWLASPRVQRAVNITTGIVLIGFAALMLYDHAI